MSGHAPVLPFGVDPLIAEAKQRARRRRLLALAAAGVVIASAVGIDLVASGGGGTNGAIPWLPTQPNIGPANPPLAPACTASQLKASLFLQGATMSLVGPVSIVNRSSQPCSLLGRPKLSFAGATSRWRETRWLGSPSDPIPFDPLAPPRGSLRALAPGEHVSVQLWWSNWCGRGAKPGGSMTQSPAAIVLVPPGGGQMRLDNPGSPVCNGGSGSLSTLQAGSFTPFVPQQHFTLPLSARIVGLALSARRGSWLSYTVVLTNTSRKPFRFGRTCPSYVEGIVAENQAYVLDCHAVGAIAPGQSVPFAMRVHVPQHVGESRPALGWTLAPHSIDAPQAPLAFVELH